MSREVRCTTFSVYCIGDRTLSTMRSVLQNVRLLRLFFVVGGAALIFIYASYSSRSLTLPHIRTRAALKSSALVGGESDESGANEILKDVIEAKSSPVAKVAKPNANNGASNAVAEVKTNNKPPPPKHHYRGPTIDVDPPTDINMNAVPANDELDEYYLKEALALGDNGAATNASALFHHDDLLDDNHGNGMPFLDLLIPTTNLQKLMENDKTIRKNITESNTSSNSSVAVVKKVVAPLSKENKASDKDVQPAVAMSLLNSIKAVPSTTQLGAHVVKADVVRDSNANAANTSAPRAPVNRVPATLSTNVSIGRIYEDGFEANAVANFEKHCPKKGRHIKLLILIPSAPSHEAARRAIRCTWGSFDSSNEISVLFLLGHSSNETLNVLVSRENAIQKDLIIGQYIDSYNNLTLKIISGLRWMDQYCPQAHFLLKTDDDMFINVKRLMVFLNTQMNSKHVIYGRLAKRWGPVRNSRSKYYISPKEFPGKWLPNFMTGPAYVISSDIVHDLVQQALKQYPLKLEDVFITGILASQLNVTKSHISIFWNRKVEPNKVSCMLPKIISVHMVKPHEQYALWKKVNASTRCE